ncbi:AIG2 family protein [Thelonectria olida]|uniref:AIG2 family protein n=1 Tax=Thelonectria olida TaxID=1576542 RepID=A0A9P9ASC6_9HYPO|nr:AIG2 family protein [Thelonectria olida]
MAMEERLEVLYFAYGSDLSTEQMQQRCPYSTPAGLAHLEGWRWFINSRGYANIAQQPLDDDDENDDGCQVALVRVEDGVPCDEYIGRMERGIECAVEEWGMDKGYVERVIRPAMGNIPTRLGHNMSAF